MIHTDYKGSNQIAEKNITYILFSTTFMVQYWYISIIFCDRLYHTIQFINVSLDTISNCGTHGTIY